MINTEEKERPESDESPDIVGLIFLADRAAYYGHWELVLKFKWRALSYAQGTTGLAWPTLESGTDICDNATEPKELIAA